MDDPHRRRRLFAARVGRRPGEPDAAGAAFGESAESGRESTGDSGTVTLLDVAAEESDDFVETAPPRPVPAVTAALPPLAVVAANPGPLPDPLPPRLDAAVRALREDLLAVGGPAAALADEICARHRDRLRAAVGR